MVCFDLVTNDGDPFSFEEATKRKDNDKWLVAMLEEMESLQKNKTWELVNCPGERKLLVASGYSTRKKHCQKRKVKNSRHG